MTPPFGAEGTLKVAHLRYMASCREMDAKTWLHVAAVIESAIDRTAG